MGTSGVSSSTSCGSNWVSRIFGFTGVGVGVASTAGPDVLVPDFHLGYSKVWYDLDSDELHVEVLG